MSSRASSAIYGAASLGGGSSRRLAVDERGVRIVPGRSSFRVKPRLTAEQRAEEQRRLADQVVLGSFEEGAQVFRQQHAARGESSRREGSRRMAAGGQPQSTTQMWSSYWTSMTQLSTFYKITLTVGFVALLFAIIYSQIDWVAWAAASQAGTLAVKLQQFRGQELCADPTSDVWWPLQQIAGENPQRVVPFLQQQHGIIFRQVGEMMEFQASPESARRPIMCAAGLFVEEHQRPFLIAAGVLTVLAGLWTLNFVRKRKQQRVQATVNEIVRILKAQKVAYLEERTPQGYMAILHLRDEIRAPPDIWDAALYYIKENESRIQERGAYIEGAQYDVLEWAAPFLGNEALVMSRRANAGAE